MGPLIREADLSVGVTAPLGLSAGRSAEWCAASLNCRCDFASLIDVAQGPEDVRTVRSYAGASVGKVANRQAKVEAAFVQETEVQAVGVQMNAALPADGPSLFRRQSQTAEHRTAAECIWPLPTE